MAAVWRCDAKLVPNGSPVLFSSRGWRMAVKTTYTLENWITVATLCVDVPPRHPVLLAFQVVTSRVNTYKLSN